ncbi:MAG: NRAMP family metal ion transporter [Gammaproteobacteria bacterium RIFCSPHIGHO2_12_FULL_40_19]|nr:MAG: NRAMP family metal ion transporter [Gammaproteobacteria bacterium RIFCSPHIGHO2_12_FULL_40_19]
MNNALSTQPANVKLSFISFLLLVFGPGLVVMFADTDAGSIIVAAQSGVQWGYQLLLLQFILMPILFVAQELAVRLGIVTGKGHGALIKNHFGKCWAWVSVGTLIVSCIGAMLSEFSGLAGVGSLYGVQPWIVMVLAVGFLSTVALTGSYRSVERIALLFGLFEMVFFVVAWMAHPSLHEMMDSIRHASLAKGNFLFLAAANIGAVIMPWMVFYQQSAVVDKKLTMSHLKAARLDTAIGAVLTQLIMAAVLISTAATIGKKNPGAALDTVHEISNALIPFLGSVAGKVLFAIGMTGAALIAAIVVSLTAAWALGEVTGFKHSLEYRPSEAPWFYATYIIILIIGAGIVVSGVNLVNLSVGVNVMNALLLPIVLGFLFLLARKTLPPEHRLRGRYGWFVGIILAMTALFGLYAGIVGI